MQCTAVQGRVVGKQQLAHGFPAATEARLLGDALHGSAVKRLPASIA